MRLSLTVCLFLCLHALAVDAYGQKKVLVVHSYHAGFEWVDHINQGIEKAMPAEQYQITTIYMDTKRQTSEAWKSQAGLQAFKAVKTVAPDIIIAADDNAQKHFAMTQSKLPNSPPIVFCGVNAPPSEYGYPNKNVTGILERPHLSSTLRLAHALDNRIKRITVIADDSFTTQQAFRIYKKIKLKKMFIQYKKAANLSQWQTAIKRANVESDAIVVFTYHALKKTSLEKTSMPPSEVMQWTVQNSKIPILGIYPVTITDGAVLGIGASAIEHGYLAAMTAKDILRSGRPAADYQINTAVEGMIMFNLQSARKFKIKIPAHMLKMAKFIVTSKSQRQSHQRVTEKP